MIKKSVSFERKSSSSSFSKFDYDHDNSKDAKDGGGRKETNDHPKKKWKMKFGTHDHSKPSSSKSLSSLCPLTVEIYIVENYKLKFQNNLKEFQKIWYTSDEMEVIAEQAFYDQCGGKNPKTIQDYHKYQDHKQQYELKRLRSLTTQRRQRSSTTTAGGPQKKKQNLPSAGDIVSVRDAYSLKARSHGGRGRQGGGRRTGRTVRRRQSFADSVPQLHTHHTNTSVPAGVTTPHHKRDNKTKHPTASSASSSASSTTRKSHRLARTFSHDSYHKTAHSFFSKDDSANNNSDSNNDNSTQEDGTAAMINTNNKS